MHRTMQTVRNIHEKLKLERAVRAFTLVELLVSIAVLSILMTLMAQLLGQTQRVWSSSSAKVSQFRESRRAFDRIVRNLSQATLNPYLQYVYPGADPRVPPATDAVSTPPLGYARYSELGFVTGRSADLLQTGAQDYPGMAVFFQAPLGTTDLADISIPTALNPIGYYVRRDTDGPYRPDFLQGSPVEERARYRLYEYRAPTESNRVYDASERDRQVTTGLPRPQWFDDFLAGGRSHPIAENILLMIIAPKVATTASNANPYSIASDFSYNSAGNRLSQTQAPQDYQLPPLADVFLVAIDERSAVKLQFEDRELSLPDVFRTASPDNLRADMQRVEEYLIEERVNYRVFSTTVQLKNSRW